MIDYMNKNMAYNEKFPKNREDILAFALSLAAHEMEAEKLEKLKLYILALCVACSIDQTSVLELLNTIIEIN